MSDQWKKLQEGAAKDKDSKRMLSATEEIAKNTKKMAEKEPEVVGDAPPLYSPGY
jgi:hypothetical protein